MTTIQLNSNFLNFVCVSTYYGIFDTNEMYNYEYSMMPSFIEWKDTDMDSLSEQIMEHYLDAMWCDFLSELGYVEDYLLETAKFYRPKFYNFHDDSFTVDLKIDKDKFMDRLNYLLNNHKDICQKFIDDNWKSRDGFWSFMPESLGELKECDEIEKVFAFVLNVDYALNFEEDLKDYPLHFRAYENLTGNSSIYDFETFQLDKRECVAEEYPLMRVFLDNDLETIEQYIVDNNIATKSNIESLVGFTYLPNILETLRLENDLDVDEEMELPINDKETAMFVILWLNGIKSID